MNLLISLHYPLMSLLSVASLNTRGLNDPIKCLSAFNFLYSENNDISLLQECNIPYKDNYKDFEKRWPYGQSVWSGDNNNRSTGVAILFKGQNFNIQRVQRVIDGRVLCVDLSYYNIHLRVINVYCPVELQERLKLLNVLQPLLVCNREVILGGDFNCLLDKKDKLTTSSVKLDSSSETLKNIINDLRLVDTYRSKHPKSPGYTWSNGRTHSRIDFLLTSKGLQPTDAAVTPVFFSDHAKIECSLLINGYTKRGKGSWKLNVSLLQDTKVVENLKTKLTQWTSLKPLFNSVGEWWEDVKVRIKNFFINVGKRKAKNIQLKLKKLQSKLQRFYTMAHAGLDVAEDISQLKREMLLLSEETSQGLLTRSRVQHMKNNEKCTRCFFLKSD